MGLARTGSVKREHEMKAQRNHEARVKKKGEAGHSMTAPSPSIRPDITRDPV